MYLGTQVGTYYWFQAVALVLTHPLRSNNLSGTLLRSSHIQPVTTPIGLALLEVCEYCDDLCPIECSCKARRLVLTLKC